MIKTLCVGMAKKTLKRWSSKEDSRWSNNENSSRGSSEEDKTPPPVREDAP
jgi:hypothetical protein